MNNRKKWTTKEEAQDYIDSCFETQNFGLSFCAACDFVGIIPTCYISRKKCICISFWADMLYGDLKAIINDLQYEIYNSEYVENHKSREIDNYLLTNEEYLNIVKEELKFVQSLQRRRKNEKRRKKKHPM